MFEMYPEMLRKSVLWPTRGNHEDFPSVYYGIFSMPAAGESGGLPSGTEAYYSFDYANVHFVCLDSEAGDTTVGRIEVHWPDGTVEEWADVAVDSYTTLTRGSGAKANSEGSEP